MAIAGSFYSKAEITALEGDGREYTTPEPDDVEKAARELAPAVLEFIEQQMRLTIPNFRLNWADKPLLTAQHFMYELAAPCVRECEREREQ